MRTKNILTHARYNLDDKVVEFLDDNANIVCRIDVASLFKMTGLILENCSLQDVMKSE